MSRHALRCLAAVAAVTATALTALASPAAAATAPGAVVSAPVAAPNGAAGSDTTVTFPYSGVSRSYTIFVPSTLPSGPRPLVIEPHWYTADAALAEAKHHLDFTAATQGAFVVYPDGVRGSWNGGTCCAPADEGTDDIGFLNAVLDDVEARYVVDSRRIAMGGYSNGGIMSYAFACSGSTRVQSYFADAAVPLTATCTPAPGLGFDHLHGLQDTSVPWNGGTSTATTDGVIPPVLPTLTGLASAEGCSGWTTTTVNSLLKRYVAKQCPAGTAFTVTTSATLRHSWPTGADAVPTYGVDETKSVWSYLIARWRNAGAPVRAVAAH